MNFLSNIKQTIGMKIMNKKPLEIKKKQYFRNKY